MQFAVRPGIERRGSRISADRPRAGVVTLDRLKFEEACADLMKLVVRDGFPDTLIGIRTGGFVVAEAMARSSSNKAAVLGLTSRRPSSAKKAKVSGLRNMMAHLPMPVLDRLRLIEHALLTRGFFRKQKPVATLDADEIGALDGWLVGAGNRPDIVVVDDAVDSGATLALVLDAVRKHAPTARIRSAVITVTTAQPLIVPDYALFDRVLCRFPWSLDAAVEVSCSS